MTLLLCALTRDVPVSVRYTPFIDRVSDGACLHFAVVLYH